MVTENRLASVSSAKQQAQSYLATLISTSQTATTFDLLAKNIEQWQRQAPRMGSRKSLSFFNSPEFVQNLVKAKKQKQYLRDSLTYLFIRDLDLDIRQPEVMEKIEGLAKELSERLDHAPVSGFMAQGYQWAKRHNCEQAFTWLSAKVYRLKQALPQALSAHQGVRKLLKVIAGVLLNEWQQKGANANFDRAIRLGYYYGLTYPLIDDLLDSQALSEADKQLLDQTLEKSLQQGFVEAINTNNAWLNYAFDELAEAFDYIKRQQGDRFDAFLNQAYVFYQAQKPTVDESDVWLNLINKSSRSRILADAMVSNEIKLGNYQYFGLFNQLHDDLKDIDLDYQEGNMTPFVALVYQNRLYDGIHPYRLYWALLHHLIYHCFENQPQVKELLIKRCINSHRSLQEQLGEQAFAERITCLTSGQPALAKVMLQLETALKQPLEMAWLDKYLSNQLQAQINDGSNALKERVEQIQARIETELPLAGANGLETAANYSLASGSKYFRGVLCVVYAQDCLGLPFEQISSVVRFIEYMHTASLIVDDKPSQDNSSMRRGRPTLHKQLNSEALAEMTALNLIFKAVEVHASMQGFQPASVLSSLEYASQLSQKICHGQWLDLNAVGKQQTRGELEAISQHKTAYAIESALVLPALLTCQSDEHIQTLKQFAYHLGIAFQIKDDLLDIEASSEQLGKPKQLDQRNQSATFVSCLGEQGATEAMYRHYYQAVTAIDAIPDSAALSQLAAWAIERSA
ncbi:polyprenyl synthetase family protein [Salinibius halmophilus]|uniref:polyprenyl synthetase family protein n=1 Tax=Salinibius halmophilus TaxID=1853216 RepID=UPI000E663FE7|nr:polyprenyl synthetase family protein [Salinibius halmophilus]